MDKDDIAERIRRFEGLDVVTAGDDTYFFYDPDQSMDPARRLPFATIMTDDANDSASNLDRQGVYRLNIGVAKDTYRALFGEPPRASPDGAVLDTGHDYTVCDQAIPHPIYAYLGWIAILDPSQATFETKIDPLLAEAHDIGRQRHARRAGMD